MAEKNLIYNIIGNDLASKAFDSVGKAAGRASKSVEKSNSSMGAAFKGIESFAKGAAGAVAGLGAVGVAALKVGEDATTMGLAIGKSRLLFGDSFGEMDRWASTLSKRIGVTRVEGLRLAGSFAMQARQAGWTQQQTIGLSKQYVELVQRVQLLSDGQFDMAGASEALAAAFRGEYDALQRVAPSIGDNTIKQAALNIKKREGNRITVDQARQLAILDIMQRSTAAGSALMQTEEGKKAIAFANAKAQITEQWQAIEMSLLPALSNLGSAVSEGLIPRLQALSDYLASDDGQQRLDNYANSLANIAGAVSAIGGAMGAVKGSIQDFNDAITGALKGFNPGWLFQDPVNGLFHGLAWATGGAQGPTKGDHTDDAREGRRLGAGTTSSGLKIPVIPSGTKLGGGGKKSDIVNMMVRIGQAGAQGLAFGIRGKASVIQDAIQSVMDKAKDTYQKQLDKLNDLKGKRTDLANSVSEGIKAAGGSAITGQGGGGVLGRLAQASRNAGSFYGALKKLRQMRLNPALLQEIAEAGPVDGLKAAREIMAAGSAASFNKQQAAIDRYGIATGALVGDSVYGAAIKKQQAAVDKAKLGMFGATIIDNRINITIPKGYVGSAKDLAAMIKDALKQSGNAGQRVVLK